MVCKGVSGKLHVFTVIFKSILGYKPFEIASFNLFLAEIAINFHFISTITETNFLGPFIPSNFFFWNLLTLSCGPEGGPLPSPTARERGAGQGGGGGTVLYCARTTSEQVVYNHLLRCCGLNCATVYAVVHVVCQCKSRITLYMHTDGTQSCIQVGHNMNQSAMYPKGREVTMVSFDKSAG